MNLASTAFALAEVLTHDDLIFIADDDQSAEALAGALQVLRPATLSLYVPSSDALPGDLAPASPSNTGKRVSALRALRQAQAQPGRQKIALFLSGEAAARRYAQPAAFDSAPPTLRVGDAVDAEAFAGQLSELGYFADDRVDEPGEMAVRGDVIDIYPADAASPARIEIADGKLASLRAYDPATQRSVHDLDWLEIGRAAEPALAEAVSILEHLKTAVVGQSAKADARRRRFIALASDAAARGGAAVDAIDDAGWQADLAGRSGIDLDASFEAVPRFAEARTPLMAFERFVRPLLADRRVVLAGSARDIRFLRARIAKRLSLDFAEWTDFADLCARATGDACVLDFPLPAGFVDARFAVIAAADILGSRALASEGTSSPADPLRGGELELRVGDVVVHEDHGVARVAGLEHAPDAVGQLTEMIALEFVGGARRLIAVDEAERIWRYGADAEAVTLDKLDGSTWRKRRADVDKAIEESAKGLAALALARASLGAPQIDPDPAAYERFANGFAFNETPDQARAINAVRTDLASGKPMDRLVVGDVGYGKTEVALRAAALAALAGYQVVVAAPTTVLVRQHLESFRKRFEGSGIAVAGLSRLTGPADKKAVKAGLADGSLQVVVGTGAVMAKGIAYANLGLVVIDEEQRFGAADKARLRRSDETHLLTLTATPIPRTLQTALIGLQELSVITTPPARRQPIRTSLDVLDDARLRTALLREKGRGGQSFVVVPRIEDMAKLSEKLRRIVPELALVEAHGKMPAAQIDEAMVDFASGSGDILLATNIIEAGLDVPRANTMIVWRADRFGLAQLHQLRGRVGRGHRRGQVILLTEGDDNVGERTLKRLRTLAAFDRLGAGFAISAQDLDMRGAGDLLGENQAGHMKLIGTELYQQLLGTALRKARGEDVARWSPQLHLGAAGLLPESWIPEADVRLGLYVRLARIASHDDLAAFEEELLDRFGPLPEPAGALIARAAVRIAARELDIERIDAGLAGIAITPRKSFVADWKRAGLRQTKGRLLLAEAIDDAVRSERVQALLDRLAA